MRNYCASIKSAAMRWVHLFLIFILTLSVRTVRAEGNDPLPIEVIEALEELFPAFDPQMISSLEVPEKNLVNIECELGGQSFDLMLTQTGSSFNHDRLSGG